MFEFTCSTCGKRVQADEALAGKHVLCPVCDVAMQAPGQSKAATDAAIREGEPPLPEPLPPLPDLSPPMRSVVSSMFFRWLPYMIVAGVVVTLSALLIPAVQKVREAAARTQTINNLKQIGLAFHSFHDAKQRLPFNGTVPAKGGDFTSGTWAFQIMPFIDSSPFFNQPNTTMGCMAYMCPGRGRPVVSDTGMWTDYFINPWVNDRKNGNVSAPDGNFKLVSVTDGTSNTIFVGHGTIDPTMYSSTTPFAQSTDVLKGGNPATARRVTTNQRDARNDLALNWGGPFPQGAMMVMGDATVRIFPYTFSGGVITNGVSTGGPLNLGVYLTPAGNEPVLQE